MIYHRLPSNRELWRLAQLIDEIHIAHSKNRCDPNPTREFKALLGQRRLAYLTGGEMDTRLLIEGDGGVDQWLTMRDGNQYPADVKAARYPKYLAVDVECMEKSKPHTIFILAEVLNHENPDLMTWDAELLRWNWKSVLEKMTPRDIGGFGIMSHAIEQKSNRDIWELLAKCERKWRQSA